LIGTKYCNCGKVRHITSNCYVKERTDVTVNQFSNKGKTSPGQHKQLDCYNCGLKGNIAKECRRSTVF